MLGTGARAYPSLFYFNLPRKDYAKIPHKYNFDPHV